MSGIHPEHKSETKTVAMGSPMEFLPFLPPRGVSNGRNVKDGLIVCVQGTMTVADATWLGQDIPRLIQSIVIEDKAGKVRWALSGLKSRIASIHFNGIERHQEHASLTAGAAKVIALRLYVPFRKRKLRRGKDFSIPADRFGKCTINWNSLAGAASGAVTLTVPALTCYLLADYHEEHSVEFKSEDVVRSVNFSSNTQVSLAPSGAVHDLLIVKESTTAGGDVVTAITDARIEELGTPLLTFADLLHSYSMKRDITPSGPTTPGTERFLEPVRAGMALPVIAADDETSVWDGKVLDSMKLEVGTGAAGLSVITREITPKSQANYDAQVGMYGIDPNTIRMKTDGKSRRGLGDGWSKRQQQVATWSAPLKKAA